MALKKQKAPAGCPEYMLTYGDMMSLLLCFFVMLVSLSEIKEDDRWMAVLESLKKAFGYNPSSNSMPGEHAPFNAKSIVESVKEHIVRQNKQNNGSDPKKRKQNQIGKSSTVRMIRDGMMFTIGGTSPFEKGRAELKPETADELLSIIEPIRGYRNKIAIRGHTSRKKLEDSPYDNHMDLSYARAWAVAEFMVTKGIERDRITIEACAGNEPVRLHAYDDESSAENERVEIIVKDTMVEDFEGDKKKNDGEADAVAPADESAAASQTEG